MKRLVQICVVISVLTVGSKVYAKNSDYFSWGECPVWDHAINLDSKDDECPIEDVDDAIQSCFNKLVGKDGPLTNFCLADGFIHDIHELICKNPACNKEHFNYCNTDIPPNPFCEITTKCEKSDLDAWQIDENTGWACCCVACSLRFDHDLDDPDNLHDSLIGTFPECTSYIDNITKITAADKKGDDLMRYQTKVRSDQPSDFDSCNKECHSRFPVNAHDSAM